MKKIISLQLDDNLFSKLKEVAENEGRTLSSLIRYILNIYINENYVKR